MVVWKVGNSFVSFFLFFCTTKKTATTRIFILVSQPLISFQRKSFSENLSAKILSIKCFFFRKVLQTPPMLFLLRLWLCAHALSDERPVAFSLADYLINLSPVG